jgi:hypothetical protein
MHHRTKCLQWIVSNRSLFLFLKFLKWNLFPLCPYDIYALKLNRWKNAFTNTFVAETYRNAFFKNVAKLFRNKILILQLITNAAVVVDFDYNVAKINSILMLSHRFCVRGVHNKLILLKKRRASVCKHFFVCLIILVSYLARFPDVIFNLVPLMWISYTWR